MHLHRILPLHSNQIAICFYSTEIEIADTVYSYTAPHSPRGEAAASPSAPPQDWPLRSGVGPTRASVRLRWAYPCDLARSAFVFCPFTTGEYATGAWCLPKPAAILSSTAQPPRTAFRAARSCFAKPRHKKNHSARCAHASCSLRSFLRAALAVARGT